MSFNLKKLDKMALSLLLCKLDNVHNCTFFYPAEFSLAKCLVHMYLRTCLEFGQGRSTGIENEVGLLFTNMPSKDWGRVR